MKSPTFLKYGVAVISIYPAFGKNPYVRLRVRPHRLFKNTKFSNGSAKIRRSRVLMAIKLNRPLLETEIVHHKDGDKKNDHIENLILTTNAEHNKHHKIGKKHTEHTKNRISKALSNAYATGKKRRPTINKRDKKGRILCSC